MQVISGIMAAARCMQDSGLAGPRREVLSLKLHYSGVFG